ncbi:MAG: hypothetical protein RML12_09675 [Xanthomonadales bacterium]|nr:hypothetical protein [Xanthomonadales bacterium]
MVDADGNLATTNDVGFLIFERCYNVCRLPGRADQYLGGRQHHRLDDPVVVPDRGGGRGGLHAHPRHLPERCLHALSRLRRSSVRTAA